MTFEHITNEAQATTDTDSVCPWCGVTTDGFDGNREYRGYEYHGQCLQSFLKATWELCSWDNDLPEYKLERTQPTT